jgi:site-specific DNA-cytosine methylase
MKFIMRNMKPTVFYHDLFCRKVDMKFKGVPFYIAGFPCTPYSTLHARSKLLRDPNARQLQTIVDTIKLLEPCVVILENVKGISRVMEHVKRILQQAGTYIMHDMQINPTRLGANVDRERVYIIMLHTSMVGKRDVTRLLESTLARIEHAMGSDASIPWEELLFADAHDLVRSKEVPTMKDACGCTQCKGKASRGACRDVREDPANARCRWRHRHWRYMVAAGLDPQSVGGVFARRCPIGALHMTVPQRHLSDIVVSSNDQMPAVWDVSQSLGRNNVKMKGKALGCITWPP